MASVYKGKHITVSVFGESHRMAVGAVADGLPAGFCPDMQALAEALSRRAAGHSDLTTARAESDIPQILSGMQNGCLTGAPLCVVFKNQHADSAAYQKNADVPRPGHADFSAVCKYKGYADLNGGGHFSGRLTLPLTFVGALCQQILETGGIEIFAHLASVGKISDAEPNFVKPQKPSRTADGLLVYDLAQGEKMAEEIRKAKRAGDSVGGIAECFVTGLPGGLGEPMFDGVENQLAGAMFAVPAVKGIEFGNGFAAAALYGSQNNDAFCVDADGEVCTKTNRHGGILGGITTGMPLCFRAAFKPTPSIAKPQQSVHLQTKTETTLQIVGRHDPCVAVRALPAVEAVTAIVLLDMLADTFSF